MIAARLAREYAATNKGLLGDPDAPRAFSVLPHSRLHPRFRGMAMFGAVLVSAVALSFFVGAPMWTSDVLFGVEPRHVPTFAAAAVLLAAVARLAASAPTRRAVRLDPVRTLRQE